MIRLKHLSGSLQGSASASNAPLLRVGRAPGCDVRFDAGTDKAVSNHHAEIVFENGAYYLIDTGSTNGTLVNGRRVQKQELKSGDRLRFGFPGGPEAHVQIDLATPPSSEQQYLATVASIQAPPEARPPTDPPGEAVPLPGGRKPPGRESVSARVASSAAEQVARARAEAGGQSSGQTMFIMAKAMKQVSETVSATTRRKWVRVVAAVVSVAAVVLGLMGVVIYLQQRQIARLMATKGQLDQEIQAVQERMQVEQDPVKLDSLEQRLAQLTGNAENTIAEIGRKDRAKAAAAVAGSDELDRDIRQILVKFHAETYQIPPIFRERLQYHIDELVKSGGLKAIYRRKQTYWPVIQKDFAALGLPEEMAYIAWTESQFDPGASNPSGARGMWQMTPSTAESFGLRVDSVVDERTDPEKQTRAAARYLANLLAEFGEDSFMLAMASYNRGEAGVRRVLHDVAQEQGGFRKEKRDFWHLYRLKKLPEETREYVPKILAAAVVCNNPERYGLAAAK